MIKMILNTLSFKCINHFLVNQTFDFHVFSCIFVSGIVIPSNDLFSKLYPFVIKYHISKGSCSLKKVCLLCHISVYILDISELLYTYFDYTP